MSNSMTIRSGTKSPKVLIVLGATIAASTAMTAPLADEDGDSSQSLRLAYSIQATSKTTPTSDPTCPLKVVVSGAGLTNLLGPIHDEQSHCAQLDLTQDHGVVTFTGASLGGAARGHGFGGLNHRPVSRPSCADGAEYSAHGHDSPGRILVDLR